MKNSASRSRRRLRRIKLKWKRSEKKRESVEMSETEIEGGPDRGTGCAAAVESGGDLAAGIEDVTVADLETEAPVDPGLETVVALEIDTTEGSREGREQVAAIEETEVRTVIDGARVEVETGVARGETGTAGGRGVVIGGGMVVELKIAVVALRRMSSTSLKVNMSVSNGSQVNHNSVN